MISNILSDTLTQIISSLALVIIGVIVIFNPIPFDFDNSFNIDLKEALILTTALSLDAVCVGIGSSIGGYLSFYFAVFVASFQILFLSLGMIIGKKIIRNFDMPDYVWNILSGIILISFGIVKLLL